MVPRGPANDNGPARNVMRGERTIVQKVFVVSAICVVGTALAGACSPGDCTVQSCADYGGDASKSFTVCFSSGTGSIDDEFWLLDSAGEELYRCTRPADDNDACGVELIVAKEAYCSEGSVADGGQTTGCTVGPVYNCGTSSAGTIPCGAGTVCCLSPGCDPTAPDPYTANGAVSSCTVPVATSGSGSAQCPSPAIQLCAVTADCPSGYYCDPSAYYCTTGP